MITVPEAIALIHQHSAHPLESRKVKVENAIGNVLAEDLIAPISLPTFRQSAMDGYAVCMHDAAVYSVIGEMKAGDSQSFELNKGEAVRIFTGGAVPASAHAVVMQEKVTTTKEGIHLEISPQHGMNIREVGEQISAGSVPLHKGHIVTPATLGLLKSLGIEEVAVNRNPKVQIIVTGNELVAVGTPLANGKIYESNGAVLSAALQQKGIIPSAISRVEDTLEATEEAISKAMDDWDLVLISGGISVGDYDFVGRALENLGVEQVFYKVLQKPGKPIFFGKKNNTYVFALPGNPGSTLSCFYVYVNLLIDRITGREHPGLIKTLLPIREPLQNKGDRALFLKANITTNSVEVLDHQNSSMMISFSKANALVYIPAEKDVVEKNELVETLILPHGGSN